MKLHLKIERSAVYCLRRCGGRCRQILSTYPRTKKDAVIRYMCIIFETVLQSLCLSFHPNFRRIRGLLVIEEALIFPLSRDWFSPIRHGKCIFISWSSLLPPCELYTKLHCIYPISISAGYSTIPLHTKSSTQYLIKGDLYQLLCCLHGLVL
jgi:hypothetical protein